MGGRPTGVSIVAFTYRIENDEGAWEGSAVMLNWPDGTTYVGPMVMTGEGAYEGLTAIIAFDGDTFWEGDCVVSGYIIEGSIPALPTTTNRPIADATSPWSARPKSRSECTLRRMSSSSAEDAFQL